MAKDCHAPTFSENGARTLYLIGRGDCPSCYGDLEPVECGVECANCGESYPIGRGPTRNQGEPDSGRGIRTDGGKETPHGVPEPFYPLDDLHNPALGRRHDSGIGMVVRFEPLADVTRNLRHYLGVSPEGRDSSERVGGLLRQGAEKIESGYDTVIGEIEEQWQALDIESHADRRLHAKARIADGKRGPAVSITVSDEFFDQICRRSTEIAVYVTDLLSLLTAVGFQEAVADLDDINHDPRQTDWWERIQNQRTRFKDYLDRRLDELTLSVERGDGQ